MRYIKIYFCKIHNLVVPLHPENRVTKNHLPQAYTGKNVLVGIIDIGIDFNHAAFRNANGSTRIKMALVSEGGTLLEFTDDSQIAGLTSDLSYESHGSHVAGTAAGSIVEGTNRVWLLRQISTTVSYQKC